jgi:hypothetical protein
MLVPKWPINDYDDAGLLPPHFLCDLDREAELGPLLVFGKDVALFGRCEAALR